MFSSMDSVCFWGPVTPTLELQSSAQADKKCLVLSFFILSFPPGRGEKKEKKMGRYSG